MSNARVGDLVRSLVDQFDVVKGKTYRVAALDSDGYAGVHVADDVGDNYYLTYAEFEEIPKKAESQEFIINGSSMLFTSQEEAEQYVMHSGFYTDGQTAEIAQVIRRAVVKRTVSVSLEDVQ